MPELKPCPFCGAEAQLSDTSNTIMVMCSRCPGRVETIYDWADGDEAQAEEYIASVWNCRAGSAMRKAAQADGFNPKNGNGAGTPCPYFITKKERR